MSHFQKIDTSSIYISSAELVTVTHTDKN